MNKERAQAYPGVDRPFDPNRLHFGVPGRDAACERSVDPGTARQEPYVREPERFWGSPHRCPACAGLLPEPSWLREPEVPVERLDFHLLSDDAQDPLYRLRVSNDEDGLITVAEENISSRIPTARATSVRTALDLAPVEARWLVGRLGVLLAARQPDTRSPGFLADPPEEQWAARLAAAEAERDTAREFSRLAIADADARGAETARMSGEKAEMAADLSRARTETERLRHERDALGQAIGEAAIKVGICRADVDGLTGPQLLLLVADMVGLVERLQLAAVAAPAPGGPTVGSTPAALLDTALLKAERALRFVAAEHRDPPPDWTPGTPLKSSKAVRQARAAAERALREIFDLLAERHHVARFDAADQMARVGSGLVDAACMLEWADGWAARRVDLGEPQDAPEEVPPEVARLRAELDEARATIAALREEQRYKSPAVRRAEAEADAKSDADEVLPCGR